MASKLARDDADLAKTGLSILRRPGLLVVDRSLNLVASNVEAIQILTFPSPPEEIPNPEEWLAKRIRGWLVERGSSAPVRFVEQFKSARRNYHCRSFLLNLSHSRRAPHPPACVLMLERSTKGGVKLAEICTHFGLTPREQDTVRLLFEGLTSKEMADRMKISPNTVKSFLRLVMVKMGVSTRSGILGKIAGSKP
ncbi:MAG: LuxR C-terminal-related transcriptional regulator [Terriglobales bacterium]|jgi:DNA-binding CsgD family transcriptional regulator